MRKLRISLSYDEVIIVVPSRVLDRSVSLSSQIDLVFLLYGLTSVRSCRMMCIGHSGVSRLRLNYYLCPSLKSSMYLNPSPQHRQNCRRSY